MSSWLEAPAQRSHIVQFYEQDDFLVEAVVQYLAAGLHAKEVLLVIVTHAHQQRVLAHLQALGHAPVGQNQLIWLDADETLTSLMPPGASLPDAGRVLQLLSGLVAKIRAVHPHGRIRAYGEMVDILWRRGQSRAALRLEEIWDDAIALHGMTVLCSYAMSRFGAEEHHDGFREICARHSHVIPTERVAQITDPEQQLRELCLLQQRAQGLSRALAQRDALGQQLSAALAREQQAHSKAAAGEDFREEVMSLIRRDLRMPLNTMLASARLMTLRGEMPRASEKGLSRIVSSGERLSRMLEQLLDVTQMQLAAGIQMKPLRDEDLGLIVCRVVDRLRVHNPLRVIEVRSGRVCRARVDADRFEQVLTSLISNAMVHGDPDRLIRVFTDAGQGQDQGQDVVRVSVHNHGAPIDPELMPLLFDAWLRPERVGPRSDALGFGLYLAQHIVRAHGGAIEVTSSLEAGTRFDVILPRAG